MLKTAPAVFAVENEYQIMVPVERECLYWVRVGETDYFDESNGILRSRSLLHRARVPMDALNRAGKYTVCVRPLIERKPYRSTTEPVQEFEFAFSPLPEKDIRIYHISDTHNLIDEPVAAAAVYGEPDLLILNGDILQHSGDPEKFDNVYEICSRITHGTKPVVFSRGNHDMRGNFAEAFADYTPNFRGNTYYTFRLGSLWGVVLDCGEDKPDDNEEYGYTVNCRAFRRRQTEFLKTLAAARPFAEAGITRRVAIVHHPFTKRLQPPFNIEEDVYTEWAEILGAFDLDLMIAGHLHRTEVFPVGGEEDAFGQPCPIVVGGKPWLVSKGSDENAWAGCGITLGEKIDILFTHSDGSVLEHAEI